MYVYSFLNVNISLCFLLLVFYRQIFTGLSEAFVVGNNTLTAFSLTKPVGSTSLGTFLSILQSAVGDRLQDWGCHGCILLVSHFALQGIFSLQERMDHEKASFDQH